jgi:phage gp36-like protein
VALFSQADLIGSVPEIAQLLTLDDDGNSVADDGVFDAVLAEATEWIEGYLEQAGETLADPPPKRLKHLGMKYAEYTLWRRRGHAERTKQLYEEWIKPANAWLDRIAAGSETLEPVAIDGSADSGGDVISETARTYPTGGGLMA